MAERNATRDMVAAETFAEAAMVLSLTMMQLVSTIPRNCGIEVAFRELSEAAAWSTSGPGLMTK